MNNFSPEEQNQISVEIARLHRFFIDWFNGIVPKTEADFKSFTSATSADFQLIPPSGELIPINALAQSLYEMHNKRPRLDIQVKNMQIQHKLGDYYLATYEEWQLEKGDEAWRGRVSTALLSRDPDTPAGLKWHHVHETWLPE